MSENFLRIELNNQQPIELNILSNSLNAFAYQYDSFLQKKQINCKKSDRKLFVNEIRKGSIIFDIVAPILPVIPDLFNGLQDFNSIVEFGTYLKDTMNFFTKKEDKKYDYSKKDCQEHINFLETTARDNNGSINVNTINSNGTINNIYLVNTTEANASQMIARKFQDELIEKEEMQYFTDKILKLVITSDRNNSIQGLIKDIFDKPRKLIINDEFRKRIIHDKENNPLSIYYIVNGEIITDEMKILAYRILEIKDIITD